MALASTYPFDHARVEELGAHRWTWPMPDGTKVAVRLAAVPRLPEPARAQLAGAAMLFATKLWQLRRAGECCVSATTRQVRSRRSNMD